MSGQGLAQQVRGNAAAEREAPTAEQQILGVIEAKLKRIEALMPTGVVRDPRRMAATVMVQIQQNPTLAQCTPESLVGCVFRVAQLGLELGADLGQAFLIPRRMKGQMQCTVQLGYRGVLELARRSPDLSSILAEPVYEHDEYEFHRGYDSDVFHHRKARGNRGEVVGAWCRWRLAGGGTEIIDIDRDEIDRRRARGGGGDAWKTDYPAMAAKSAVMAAKGFLPLTTQAAEAFAQDGAAITVSSRGPAALVADHGVALEPPRQVDTPTGEIEPPEAPPPPPTTPEQTGADVAAVLDAAGINPPLHLACIAKASGGRTTVASELDEREARNLINHARACAASPEAFVRSVVTRMVESEEKAALVAWLDAQPADPS